MDEYADGIDFDLIREMKVITHNLIMSIDEDKIQVNGS